jgi:hypothetical protein
MRHLRTGSRSRDVAEQDTYQVWIRIGRFGDAAGQCRKLKNCEAERMSALKYLDFAAHSLLNQQQFPEHLAITMDESIAISNSAPNLCSLFIMYYVFAK